MTGWNRVHNETMRGAADLFTGETTLPVALRAFVRVDSDLPDRLRAAIRAAAATHLTKEPPLDLGEGWERLSPAEVVARLEAAGLYVRSAERKDAHDIARRELERRKAFAALRAALTVEEPKAANGIVEVTLACFPELGEVPLWLPVREEDDGPGLALPTAPGLGTLDLLLHAAFGPAGPLATVSADPDVLTARLQMADGGRGPFAPGADPAGIAELLATTTTLGGLPVLDGAADGGLDEHVLDAIADALDGAVLWRPAATVTVTADGELGEAWTDQLFIDHGPVRWRASDDNGGSAERIGLLLMVVGEGVLTDGGLPSGPVAHHTFVLLAVPDPGDPERIGALHRVVTSCPGPGACLRGGCVAVSALALEVAAGRRTVARAAAFATTLTGPMWRNRLRNSRVLRAGDDAVDAVPTLINDELIHVGWEPLWTAQWEGGLIEVHARRGDEVLAVEFDPVTRQVRAYGDAAALNLELDILAEAGHLREDGSIDREAALADGWDAAVLDAVGDADAGRLRDASPALSAARSLTLTALPPTAADVVTVADEPEFVGTAVAAMLRSLPAAGA